MVPGKYSLSLSPLATLLLCWATVRKHVPKDVRDPWEMLHQKAMSEEQCLHTDTCRNQCAHTHAHKHTWLHNHMPYFLFNLKNPFSPLDISFPICMCTCIQNKHTPNTHVQNIQHESCLETVKAGFHLLQLDEFHGNRILGTSQLDECMWHTDLMAEITLVT